jgi:hypothetical protein
LFQLLTNFYEDYYSKHKLESQKDETGQVILETGDPLIDKWEKELAMGLDPDVTEGLPEHLKRQHEEADKFLKERKDKFEDNSDDKYFSPLPVETDSEFNDSYI